MGIDTPGNSQRRAPVKIRSWHKLRSRKARDERYRRKLRRQLALVTIISIAGGILAAVVELCGPMLSISTERQVALYRTHGCTCALAWRRSLETAGFEVQSYEPESLEPIRSKLRIPERLHSCHVAVYMGYFLEGHLPASALHKLEEDRPLAIGAAMETSWQEGHSGFIKEANQGAVLLFDESGLPRPWLAGIGS